MPASGYHDRQPEAKNRCIGYYRQFHGLEAEYRAGRLEAKLSQSPVQLGGRATKVALHQQLKLYLQDRLVFDLREHGELIRQRVEVRVRGE